MKRSALFVLAITLIFAAGCGIDEQQAGIGSTADGSPADYSSTPADGKEKIAVSSAKTASTKRIIETAAFAQDEEAPQALNGEIIPCPMGLPMGEVEGETFVCGQIEVPQNWDEPDGKTINISYAILKTANTAPPFDPVIYFDGGPGQSALNQADAYVLTFDRLRRTRDVILWDQRGTTYSNVLDCPIELQVTDVEAYDEQHATYDERIAEFDGTTEPDLVYETVAEFMATEDFGGCLPYFEEQGIDVTQYNTANSVRDSLALMNHLGYPAYNLYGISYGTNLALAIADYYENNPELDLPAVRSAVIDGIFPRNAEWYDQAFFIPWNILRTFSDCEADEACGAAYPDIRQRAIDLLASLEESPIERQDGSEATLDDLVQVMNASVSTRKTLLPYLPRIVAELEEGETAALDYALADLNNPFALPIGEMGDLAIASGGSQAEEIMQQLEALQEQVKNLTLGSELVQQAALAADSKPTLFTALLDAYLQGNVNMRSFVSMALQGPMLHEDQRTADQLLLMASGISYKPVADEMTALINSMDEDEIAELYDLLLRPEFLSTLIGTDMITNAVIDCNDRASSFVNDVAFEKYGEFEAPQLLNSKVSLLTEYQIRCEQLGLDAPDYEPRPAGVATDWRMLVVNGALDTHTPVEWGESAFQTLTNAEMITVPLAGHGASVQSDCGKDIANAFILSPEEDLNLSCVEAIQTVFVLPDEELPAQAEQ